MRIGRSVGTAMLVSLAAVQPTLAQATAQGGVGGTLRGAPHVRGLDAKAVTLLAEGAGRSATLWRLVERLEGLDVVVWVTTGTVANAPGKLAIVGAAQGWRLLRITISLQNAHDLQIAHLAHELQHAVEVATEPTVVNAATLKQFYWTHGNQVGQDSWCTTAAQTVTRTVAFEVGRSRPK